MDIANYTESENGNGERWGRLAHKNKLDVCGRPFFPNPVTYIQLVA